ncbi:retinol dehydrogenase 7-like [Protopterus annectens]|uniref:retinol dehydrogenase 7-like n=1 Tax=Protopterus annectens TaxID=7888 RepID=UPI001CFAD141|nr:retinol dehydrogenase 7-like [Protopterus annectens]
MWLYLFIGIAIFLLHRWYRERQQVSNITQKYVLITGSDSGFGNLLARQLDAQGMPVLAACLTEKGAEELKKVTSKRLQTTILDVTKTESIMAAADWAKTVVGDKGLWGLVNNAGISIPTAPNIWMGIEDFRKVMDVNLFGVIEVTLNFLPMLMKSRGRLVNVASVFGRNSVVGGGYCLSKYGVESFSDSLRCELYSFGVKVCIIEPGFFKTAMTDPLMIEKSLEQLWSRLPAETKDAYGEHFLKEYKKTVTEMAPNLCSHDLSKVTDCMEHALTAVYPRKRYSAGWDAKLFWIPISYFPSAFSDFWFTLHTPKPQPSI